MADDVEYYEATRQQLIRDIDAQNDIDVLDEIRNLKINSVLDIGSGMGQALYPLAIRKGAFGIGIDISEYALRMGREFYADNIPHANVAFVKAQAERLPFASETFDLVNFGLALPYTHNPSALAEIERVLRPEGRCLLKIHHFKYYLIKLRKGLMEADLLSMIHCGRVLTNGTIYHLTRRQPMTKLLNETYQTRWLLKRELANSEMMIDRERPSNPAAPAFVIRKKQNRP